MKINFTGRNIEITNAIQQLITDKFDRIKEHYNHSITKTEVILSVEKLVNAAEINIHIAGEEINAHAQSDDMYKAIDMMIRKLDRQLMKHKEKMSDH